MSPPKKTRCRGPATTLTRLLPPLAGCAEPQELLQALSRGLVALPAAAPVDAVRDVVSRLRGTCTAAGGSLVVLDAAPAVKAAVDTWGPVPAIELMQRVKEQFDPERRLAPGRFVGGI